MIKFCIIGAGSAEFSKRIVGDVLRLPEFKNIHLALMDIDAQRLHTTEQILTAVAAQLGATPTISTHTARADALRGADFVQTTIQVGGYHPATVIDFAIPKKYGLRQTIGDTLGIGGIMRGLRTIPVLRAIGEDMLRYCPQAVWLQYVNPMAINMLALQRTLPQLRAVGLCHSVSGTAEMLARDLGENLDDIVYDCAGINHLAFYTRLEKRHADGSYEDLYPRLKEKAAAILNGSARAARTPEIHGGCLSEKVRYDLLLKFGYFVTESSEHFAEYVPWYIRPDREDLIAQFDIPLDEYPARCQAAQQKWQETTQATAAESAVADAPSREYAAGIMRAIVRSNNGGGGYHFYGNVANTAGLIPNLPRDCCVEVPCTANAAGIHPHAVAPLPPQLAALMQSNINVQILTVEAALTQKREHIYQAALLDPHTAAALPPDRIIKMTDELLAAHTTLPPFPLKKPRGGYNKCGCLL